MAPYLGRESEMQLPSGNVWLDNNSVAELDASADNGPDLQADQHHGEDLQRRACCYLTEYITTITVQSSINRLIR